MILALLGSALAGPTFDTAGMRFDLRADGAAIAAGAGAFVAFSQMAPRWDGSVAEVDDPRWDTGAAAWSDVLSPAGLVSGHALAHGGGALPVLALVAAGGLGGAYADRPGQGAAGFILAGVEAMSLTAGATEAWKQQRGRARPYTDPDFAAAFPDAGVDPSEEDAHKSMPSGHTSMAAALYASLGTTWLLHELEAPRLGPQGWLAPAATLAGGVALGGLVGHLRVAAGMHHEDDVRNGLLLGTAVGVAVPAAHWAWGRSAGGVEARPGGIGWSGTF